MDTTLPPATTRWRGSKGEFPGDGTAARLGEAADAVGVAQGEDGEGDVDEAVVRPQEAQMRHAFELGDAIHIDPRRLHGDGPGAELVRRKPGVHGNVGAAGAFQGPLHQEPLFVLAHVDESREGYGRGFANGPPRAAPLPIARRKQHSGGAHGVPPEWES